MRRLLVPGLLLLAAPALSYEPQTTLAGLTQRAALSSRLHRRLVDGFGRSLGLFDPVRLHMDQLPAATARDLRNRLHRLDPAEGYAPSDPGERSIVDGRAPFERQSALAWLSAGTVLESVPTWRLSNHFLDPQTGGGLRRPAGLTVPGATLRALGEGLSSFRQLMTGTAFDGSGPPATSWLVAPDNELGLVAFQRALGQAVLGETAVARDTALVQALLAAGGMLSLLEQMGDPAYVRNDLSHVLGLGTTGRGGYERMVALRYGRAGIPQPRAAAADEAPIRRLADLFQDPTHPGAGLAERTARRFYSAGTLPGRADVAAPRPGGLERVYPLTVGAAGDVRALARVPAGWPTGMSGYVRDADVQHLLAWQRVSVAGVPALLFSLDERCYRDYAAALLPEIGRYAQRALDFLFRGELRLEAQAEPEAGVRVLSLGTPLGAGTLTVLGEGPDGKRRVLQTVPVAAQERPGEVLVFKLPADPATRRLAVLYQGVDTAGEPLLIPGQLALPENKPEEAAAD